MSASTPRLAGLPVEVLERIVLHLPGQDIIKMDAVSRQFRDLSRSSPELQCQRELFAAGLIDNPRSPCNLGERRRLCRNVPLEHPFRGWRNFRVIGRNLIAIHTRPENTIDFLHIPPAMSRGLPEQWSIPKLPFEVSYYTGYLPENILVVAEEKEGFIHIHLLNLLDGSPHRVPHSNVITWPLPPGIGRTHIQVLAMTGSRLVLHIFLHDESSPHDTMGRRLLLWNWKTGDMVLDRSNADRSGPTQWNRQVAFLDEFRIMVLYESGFPDAPELVVFNTLVPQGDPRNLRRFRLPPVSVGRGVHVHLDRDRSLGMVNRDGPLIVDSSQAILILTLFPTVQEPQIFFILQTQPLIERVHTDTQIPWDEWGRGALVMEVPIDGGALTIIHGTHVLVIDDNFHGPGGRYRVHVFDFSRRGSAPLLLLDGNDGGAERRAVFADGRSCEFEGGERTSLWDLQPLGDTIPLSVGTHPDHVLHVLDMM